MDFVTVTHMGIIFALQSYRNIFFLVRTTEFLFPAVMTYECYFLYYYSNKVLHLGIPKFRCTWARYSFVANRQYSPFCVVPRGRLVCIATGIDIALIRLFAKIQSFLT